MSAAEATGLRRLAGDLTPTAIVCLAVIGVAAFIAIFAPLIAPYDEGTILTNESFASPGNGMLLGSDYLGRDIASRLGFGIRTTLSVALAISVIAFLIGSALGFFAAIMGGWTDTVVSRTVDALISFPAIMIALIVVSSLGSTFLVLIVTVAIIDSTRVFRVARALGMDIVVQDYIEAARGARRRHRLDYLARTSAQCHGAACGGIRHPLHLRHPVCLGTKLSRSRCPAAPFRPGPDGKGKHAGTAVRLILTAVSRTGNRNGHRIDQHSGRLVSQEHRREFAGGIVNGN